jgi:transposase
VVKTGCQWRQLPADFPPWQSVHQQFRAWRDNGTWERIGKAKEMFGYKVEVVKRNELHTFQVLPKRWIVERTFAWLAWSRRLSKDYELRHTSAETMIHIAFAHLLLRRLA